jgi:hypothetical protein
VVAVLLQMMARGFPRSSDDLVMEGGGCSGPGGRCRLVGLRSSCSRWQMMFQTICHVDRHTQSGRDDAYKASLRSPELVCLEGVRRAKRFVTREPPFAERIAYM